MNENINNINVDMVGDIRDKYTIIPNQIFKLPVTVKSKYLLIYLISLPKNWVINNSHIKSQIDVSEKILTKLWKELTIAEVIKKKQIRNNGDFCGCQVTIFMDKIINNNKEAPTPPEEPLAPVAPTSPASKDIYSLDLSLIERFKDEEQEAIKDFIQHRIDIKNKFTTGAFKAFLSRCKDFKSKGYNIVECINYSISSGIYPSIYEPKPIYKNGKPMSQREIDMERAKDILHRCNDQDFGEQVPEGVWG